MFQYYQYYMSDLSWGMMIRSPLTMDVEEHPLVNRNELVSVVLITRSEEEEGSDDSQPDVLFKTPSKHLVMLTT